MPPSSPPPSAPAFAVLALYGCGVLAAAGLGRFAALIPLVGHDLSLSLTAAAWLASLLELGGASLGIAAGWAVGRLGTRRPLVAGLALLAVGGVGAGLAAGTGMLFAARLVEAVGYLAVVVAAPTWIVAAARDRDAALALWSTFVPVGMALGAASTALAVEVVSWRTVLVGFGLVAAVAALAAGRLAAAEPPRHGGRIAVGAAPWPVWALAAGFGCYAAMQVGMLTLYPSHLVASRGMTAGAAGLAGAAVSLANIPGGLAAAAALGRGVRPLALLAASLVAAAPLVALAFAGSGGAATAIGAAILGNAALGVAPAVMFARLPTLAGGPARAAAGNGLFAQFGASGSLIGPPLVAAGVAAWGWASAGAVSAALIAACLTLAAVAERGHAAAGRTR